MIASFTISRVRWVKGVDGEAERDDIELCTRSTLKEAMDAVRTLMAEETYVVDMTPRGDARFPACWGKGGPDARAEGEKVSEEVTENLATVQYGQTGRDAEICRRPA